MSIDIQMTQLQSDGTYEDLNPITEATLVNLSDDTADAIWGSGSVPVDANADSALLLVGNHMAEAPRFQTGKYVGTGSNSVTIATEFEPKLVFITNEYVSSYGNITTGFGLVASGGLGGRGNSGAWMYKLTATKTSFTLKDEGNGDEYLTEKNEKYFFAVFG